MAEARKSDFTGDVFGDWTVVAKAPAQGDRIRRWIVKSEAGVEMTVAQTSLSDLALTKRLQDAAEEKPLSRQIADSVIAANADHKLRQGDPFSLYLGPDETPDVMSDVFAQLVQSTPEGAEDDEICTECEEAAEAVLAGPGLDDYPALSIEPDSPWVDSTKTTVQSALDSIIKAKAALNAAAKALEGLL